MWSNLAPFEKRLDTPDLGRPLDSEILLWLARQLGSVKE